MVIVSINMAFLLSALALVIRLVVALPVPLPLSGG